VLLLNQTKTENKNNTQGGLRRGAESGMDRRRGLRISQARPIKVFEPMTARYFGGQTCDISSTGLKIELPASNLVTAGRTISVHVGVSDKGQALANRRAMMPARVVWVVPTGAPGSGRVMAGVEFVVSMEAHLSAA